ncbi:hypothetical protein [Nitriliruptor alkaliphilus]|uniref:hypothetical protein n=1 Tax=Nitriliruptor alkaliphilus TaxID=427918 RepID=UPI000697CC11|nr:hypothetical protein [Nitriliruptor alkaliphilus]
MPRRFITADDVDRLVDAGTTELRFGDDTTVTDIARERARERGLTLIRDGDAPPAAASGSGPAPTVAAADRGRIRAEVRAAVVAELGSEPPQLERIIDRVLDEHR